MRLFTKIIPNQQLWSVITNRAMVATVEKWKAMEGDLTNLWWNETTLSGFHSLLFPSSYVVWRAPAPWWVKVHGSFCAPTRRGGAGAVIRDHDGRLILAVSISLLGISVPLVEMIAAWNVIRNAVLRLGGDQAVGGRGCLGCYCSNKERRGNGWLCR